MTRLVVLQHLEPGDLLLVLGGQVARQGERLIANLLELLTADLVGR
jgi:hypothetical protein